MTILVVDAGSFRSRWKGMVVTVEAFDNHLDRTFDLDDDDRETELFYFFDSQAVQFNPDIHKYEGEKE